MRKGLALDGPRNSKPVSRETSLILTPETARKRFSGMRRPIQTSTPRSVDSYVEDGESEIAMKTFGRVPTHIHYAHRMAEIAAEMAGYARRVSDIRPTERPGTPSALPLLPAQRV